MTGGRGSLASLIAGHFHAPAHEVTLFSRRQTNDFSSLYTLTDAAVLSRSDVLMHLAWSSLPATAEQHPGIEDHEDLAFLGKLLAALVRQPGHQRPHLVFFSSGGAVYGNAPHRPNVESDPCLPLGRYGRAKLAAEEMINACAAREGLPCTILRISNPYGYPVPRHRAQGLIPHALRCAVEGQPLTLWGDGSARKDFLYYTDILAALDHVVAKRLSGTFNVCAGESHSVNEVIRFVELVVGKAIALDHIPAPAWDVHDSRLSSAHYQAATGWYPQVPIAEGIRRAAAGYVGSVPKASLGRILRPSR